MWNENQTIGDYLNPLEYMYEMSKFSAKAQHHLTIRRAGYKSGKQCRFERRREFSENTEYIQVSWWCAYGAVHDES